MFSIPTSEVLPPRCGTSRPLINQITTLCITLALVAVAFGTAGCAGTQGSADALEKRNAPWRPSNDLIEIDTEGRGILLVRPDHQLGRYDHVLIDRIGFRYSEDQSLLSYREEDRISAMLASMVQGSQDGTVGVVEEPGPCVLSVRLSLVELELHEDDNSSSSTSFIDSFGEATVIMELLDSETEVPLARFLQRRDLGGGPVMNGTASSLQRLGKVVGVTMQDMGSQLAELTPPTAEGWSGNCDGGIARASTSVAER